MISGKTQLNGTKFEFAGDGWQAFTWLRRLRAIGGPDFIETLLDIQDGQSGGGTAH